MKTDDPKIVQLLRGVLVILGPDKDKAEESIKLLRAKGLKFKAGTSEEAKRRFLSTREHFLDRVQAIRVDTRGTMHCYRKRRQGKRSFWWPAYPSLAEGGWHGALAPDYPEARITNILSDGSYDMYTGGNFYGDSSYEDKDMGNVVIVPKSKDVQVSFTPEKPCISWTMRVTHPKAIDFNTIAEDLSPEEPLIFIESGQAESNFVLVHRSVVRKAAALSLYNLAPDGIREATTSGAIVVALDSRLVEPRKQFSAWKKWVKRVRSASWPDGLRNHTFTVTKIEV